MTHICIKLFLLSKLNSRFWLQSMDIGVISVHGAHAHYRVVLVALKRVNVRAQTQPLKMMD